jgi:dipeptide transport system ATP-binding protein
LLLNIKNLNINFDSMRGSLHAVRDLSFSIKQGETLGIVGESGCGKSITSLAIMDLLPPTGHVTADTFEFEGKDLLAMNEKQKTKIRGRDIAMIFQDPMTSLNPSFTVGYQLMETIKIHFGGTKEELKTKAIDLLKQVGIPAPESRMNNYPHHLSGGMSQRVMIAIAIACRPKLLIADEPTTALDVTIQAQILALLKDLQKEYNMAIILITHDIGVVAQMADRLLVMYSGECIETGSIRDVIKNRKHPYTEGLLASLPSSQKEKKHRAKLPSIPGLVPDLLDRPSGCQFNPRCEYVEDMCKEKNPIFITNEKTGQIVKCLKPLSI